MEAALDHGWLQNQSRYDPQQRRRTLEDELCEKLAEEKKRLTSLKNALTGLADMLMDFRIELGQEEYEAVRASIKGHLNSEIRDSEDKIRALECRILDVREGTRFA